MFFLPGQYPTQPLASCKYILYVYQNTFRMFLSDRHAVPIKSGSASSTECRHSGLDPESQNLIASPY